VTEDVLTITIPEYWLADAAYPVVVDPVIGTSTVGSQTEFDSYGELVPLYFDGHIPVNRFLVPETIEGTLTASIYSDEDDPYNWGKPVIYSDNNNLPSIRRSAQESPFDFALEPGKTAGWTNAAFTTNTTIDAGSYIWFGVFTKGWSPRFDYGATCVMNYW
jgi:hypothetical protein